MNIYQLSMTNHPGIPEIQVGMIGMIPALGHLMNAWYDIYDYLHHTKQFSLRAIQCSVVAAIVVNCAGYYL